MTMNKLALLMLASISAGLVSTVAVAKEITLFEQPNDKAKIVGTVDLAVGIIPIFTPKDSQWVKIADPRNGNTGWVKTSDLSPNGSSSFSFSTRYISDDKNKNRGYQLIQIGDTDSKSNQQIQSQLLKLQEQQAAIQQSVNKSIENMVKDMNKLYKQYQEMMKESGVPVVMPVMLVPVKAEEKK
jgi:hypothetical protein